MSFVAKIESNSEFNSILDTLIDTAHRSIGKADAWKNRVSPENLNEALSKFSKLSKGRTQVKYPAQPSKFEDMVDGMSQLNPQKKKDLSQVIALDTLITNAANAADRAHSMTPIKEQMQAFLKDNPDTTAVESALKKLTISLVHTIHPTIYHTQEARLFESALTKALEAGNQDEAQKLVEEFATNVADGKADVTPMSKVSVTMENQIEADNFENIRKQLREVISAWNEVVKDQHPELAISPEREKQMIELRTWGRSADADGREKSTSQFLHESIQQGKQNGSYNSEILDLRQNAREHSNFFSSLVQVKYRNNIPLKTPINGKSRRYNEDEQAPDGKHFEAFCEEFMKDRAQHYTNGEWLGPRNSIYQVLNKDDRFDFVAQLAEKGYTLVPEQLKKDVLDFNLKINSAKAQFLKDHAQYIQDQGYDPATITYDEMVNVTVPDKLNDENSPLVSLRRKWKEHVKEEGFELQTKGLQYRRLTTNGPEESRMEDYLESTYKLKDDEKQELSPEERATYMDIAKRLIVVKSELDNQKPGETPVATRYQIAGFSEPADFMIALKLFADTGIANIENGKITKTQLGIMPLLETETDLNNAEAIFEKILSNPLAESYFKQRGMAEIMVGFSDGAASAGNFASQWAIHQAMDKLTELFEKHDIPVRFFQGRGRGVNRGGTVDPSLQLQLVPPSVQKTGVYDATIQSDLPMDLAASDAYGKDYFTKIMLSTLGAQIKASSLTPEEITRHEKEGEILTQIAADASARYNSLVRENKNVLAFLNSMPRNANNSSRSITRGGKIVFKSFDEVRAIPKEYLANTADLPMHNAGLAGALKDRGEDVASLKDNPFFSSMMQTIGAGLSTFDPEIAKAYFAKDPAGNGKEVEQNVNARHFVDDVSADLRELGLTLKRLDSKLIPAPTPSIANSLDHMAHALIVDGKRQGKSMQPNKNVEDQNTWWETLANAVFTTTQEVGHVQLPEKAQSRGA